jgi:hemerythrin-like domain-containing protein
MEELRMEHEAVTLTLRVLEEICRRMERQGDPGVGDAVTQLLEFFSVFVDKCHHGKEEELLFPALEQVGVRVEGGPIGVLLKEHQQGRECVRKMKASFSEYRPGEPASSVGFCQDAREYVALLGQHIEKENNVLFPLAERELSEAKQAELSDGFERIENEKIGVGRHEQFHQMLDNLKGLYLHP